MLAKRIEEARTRLMYIAIEALGLVLKSYNTEGAKLCTLCSRSGLLGVLEDQLSAWMLWIWSFDS